MQISEMIEANNKLEQYYEKEITSDQSKILYEELKDMSIEKYQRALSICLRTCKFMPKLADIIKASQDIENVNYSNEKKVYTPCKDCGGSGYVTYGKILYDGDRALKYQYAARCICENGLRANQIVPTYIELGIKPNEEIRMEVEE